MTNSQKNKPIDAPIILGLEASGEHASAAIVQNGIILAQARLDQRHGHASHFVSLAAHCVKEAGISFADLTHIAAGVGPGSFTGLRVCLSAAKGFVLAGNLVGIGVHGLRARAFAALNEISGTQDDRLVMACADTRRGVYFHQPYDSNLQAKGPIGEADLNQLLPLQDHYHLALPPTDQIEDDSPAFAAQIVEMTAVHIALLAEKDIAQAQDSSDLPALDPLYVAAPKLGPAKKGVMAMPPDRDMSDDITPFVIDFAAHDICFEDLLALGAHFDEWGYGAFDPPRFSDDFAKPPYGACLVKEDGLLGALLYRIAGDEAEIIELAVHGAYRRRSIGRKMLDSLSSHAKENNLSRLILEVAEDNHGAIALYEAAGFGRIGLRPRYYQRYKQEGGNLEKIDAIIMELWLSKA